MISHPSEEKFRLDHTITSLAEAYAEWNYNSFEKILDYGCYKKSSDNPSYVIDSGYDLGKNTIFFEGEGVDTTYSGTSGSSSITVEDSSGISIGMRVVADEIPADCTVSNVSGTTITISEALNSSVTSKEVSFFSYDTDDDQDRLRYSPLISVFEPNRPDPGIIQLTGNIQNPSEIIDVETITVANFGNISGTERLDRIYPIYKNSKYRYWNSVRKVLQNGLPTTVGVADSSGNIENANPFVVYSNSFFANKIVVKTQKYGGVFPSQFTVEVLPDGSNSWTSVYTGTSTDLQSGKLSIFYNGTSWTKTESAVTQFIGTPSNALKIKGVRLSVTKMSKGRASLELIEISPRLYVNLTDYLISFDKMQSLSTSNNSISSAGVISATGGLRISNVDRLFSVRNPNSILSGMLHQGTEIRIVQNLDGQKIPIGTFYSISWNESNDYTVNVEVEDYFFFLKSMKAPEINIANVSGIETSVALLMLFDNIGVTNFNFVKKSSEGNDDFIMEFFYCDSELTVFDVLTRIAESSQYAIYVDVDNMITASTKDRFSEVVSFANTDFWAVGSENWDEDDPEYSALEGAYISNIVSMSESVNYPITEASIGYAGNGIIKNPMSIMKTDLGLDSNSKDNLLFNASLVARDLSYGIQELWSVDSSSGGTDQSLLCMSYISDVSESMSSELDLLLSESISGSNEDSVVRYVYGQVSDKSYFEIKLDPEFGTLFISNGKFSGYVLIDSEIIKYRGLVLDIFDSKSPEKSGRSIVFNEQEYAEIRANVGSGSSILCKALLVDLNFEAEDISEILSPGEKQYVFTKDGRGYNGTLIQEHKAQTNTTFTNNHFVTKLYDSSYNKAIKPSGTIIAKPVKLNDPRVSKTYSKDAAAYPGHLLFSGPKGRWDKNQDSNLGSIQGDLEKALPVDNLGERFITGFMRSIKFVPERISTRMRLLEKPKTEYFKLGETKDTSEKNRGIAGIGFRLKEFSTGTTGYFLEIEDVGNITADQIASEFYDNLRLYKVVKTSSGKFVPKVLGSEWVNVSAVAGRTVDAGQAAINNGMSYTGTSDISITVEKVAKNYVYTVYWEAQKVLQVKEPISEAINKKSDKIGVFGRSNSEAMFEYIMAASTSKNGNYSVSSVFTKGSPFMKLEDATSRGLLPPGLAEIVVGKNKAKTYYEDFGKMLREVRRMQVSFETPAVYAQVLSLANVNPDYYVSGFTSSSFGADFWVFNTSNSNLNLGGETNTPLIISGVAINNIASGQITLSEYIKNRVGENLDLLNIVERNRARYGTNSLSISGEYLNSLSQANNLMQWIVENSLKPKKNLNLEIFPNPLLEIGDKVRVFFPEMEYNVLNGGDVLYYINTLSYSVDESGPKMSVSLKEV